MKQGQPTGTEQFLPMGRLHAIALTLFGPPDTPSHPFTGTRYDPRLRQQREQARRHDRVARRARASLAQGGAT